MYRTVLDKSVRSRMNICFRVTKGAGRVNMGDAEKGLLGGATGIGLLGLEGHRSVGRRYVRPATTPFPLASAKKLAAYIETLTKL